MKIWTRSSDSTAFDPDLAAEKIKTDRFLTQFYSDGLRDMLAELNLDEDRRRVIEIGSAGGITKTLHPWIETTDVRDASGIDRVVDASFLPYADDSLDGVIAKDALHHIPDVTAHFSEVSRALRPGARAAYLEPNWNGLSRAVFRWIHPEPFDAAAELWNRESSGPMDSNQALAYIVFERDLALFRRSFPALWLEVNRPRSGLAFLLSGGVHSRLPIPSGPLIRLKGFEDRHHSFLRRTALSRLLVLEKRV